MTELTPEKLAYLIEILRDIDKEQVKADRTGAREISWFYYRGKVEALLGFQNGELFDYGDDDEEVIL